MRVVALMAFYQEEDAMLEAAVGSLQGLADHLVAVDGAYALYPGGTAVSGGHDVIRRTAEEAGIGLTLHVPGTTWGGGEIEKRDTMFRLGEEHTTEADWFYIQDADFVVTTNRDARAALEETEELAADVCLINSDGNFHPHRLFFKALRNIRVRNAHYQWQVEPDGPVMWDFHRKPVPSLDLTQSVIVDHNDDQRPENRTADRWIYYTWAAQQGLDDPVKQAGYVHQRDHPHRVGRKAGRRRAETEQVASLKGDALMAHLQAR